MTSFRERLLGGEHLVGCFLNMGSPLAAEICAQAGFDWLLLDLEHGSATEADVLPQLQAIAGRGVTPLVRVEGNQRARFSKALDFGAEGIMVPQLEGPDDVRAAVSFCRYAPAGVRGVGMLQRAAAYGQGGREAVDSWNERAVCIVQIETPRAIERLDEIAAVEGADCLFVGPSDLSHALGVFLDFDDPSFVSAIGRVQAAAAARGKAAGVLVRNAQDHDRYRELGYTFIGVGSDSSFLSGTARDTVKGVRPG